MKNHRLLLHRIFRIALLAGLVLAVLLTFALVFFTLPPGEEILRARIEHELESALHQPVSLSSFETNLVSRIYLGGIHVESQTASGAREVLTIRDVTLRYNLWRLLSRELALDVVSIDSISLHLHRQSNGTTNLAILDSLGKRPPTAKDSVASAGMPFKISLNTLAVRDLTIDITDQGSQLSAVIRHADITAQRDKEDTYAVHFQTGNGTLRYAGQPPNTLFMTASGSWSPTSVRLDTLVVKAMEMTLHAAGYVDSLKRVEGNVWLTGKPDALLAASSSRFHTPVAKSQGELSAKLHASGQGKSIALSGRMVLPSMIIRRVRLSGGFVAGRWNGDVIDVDSLVLRAGDGSIQGKAHATIGGTPRAEASVLMRNLDIGSIWSSIFDTISAYQGKLSGSAALSGEGSEITGWGALLDVQTSNLRYHSKPSPELQMHAALKSNRYEAVMQLGDMNAVLHGSISDQEELSGSFSLTIPDLAPIGSLAGVQEVTGNISATGALLGKVSTPRMDIVLKGQHILYQNFPVDDIAAELSLSKEALLFQKLSFSGGLDSIDWRYPVFHLDSLGGGFHYAGEFAGPVKNLQGILRLDLLHPRYGKYGTDMANLTLSIDTPQVVKADGGIYRRGKRVDINGRFDLTTSAGTLLAEMPSALQDSTQSGGDEIPSGRLAASFSRGADQKLNMLVRGNDLDLHAMRIMVLDSLPVDGKLFLEARLSGSLTDPTASLRLALRQVVYDSLRIDSLLLEANFRNHVLDIPRIALAASDEKAIGSMRAEMRKDSTGTFAFTPHSPTRGKLDIPSLNLHLLQTMLPAGTTIVGSTSLHLRWNGTIDRPRPEGDVSIQRLSFARPGMEVPFVLNFKGGVRDSMLRIESSDGQLLGVPFELNGYVMGRGLDRFRTDIHLGLTGHGDITARGEVSHDQLNFQARIDSLDLAMAETFLPKVKSIAGRADCDISLSGNMREPQTAGFIKVRDLGIVSTVIDSPLTRGSVDIAFRGSTIQIDSISAHVGGGTMMLKGSATYTGGDLSDADLKLDASGLSVSSPDRYLVRLDSARISMKREHEFFLLNGDVKFGESRYLADVEPGTILARARSVEKANPIAPTFFQRTRLHVRVRGSDSLWIDNNVAKARMHAEIAVIGTLAQPNFSGRLSAPEGKIFYLDRDFDIQEATADFTDPYRFNPLVNFKAEAVVVNYTGMQSTNYTVRFMANGPLDKLVTQLSSDPPLDNSDIVALLTLGRTRTQLTGNGSGGERMGNVLAERAQMLAGEKLSGILSRRASGFLGLDQVSVTGNLLNFSDSGGPGLVVTKKISDRAKLTYSTNVGHMNEQSIRVDYLLAKRFSLEGETAQGRNSSLSIKYGFRFP